MALAVSELISDEKLIRRAPQKTIEQRYQKKTPVEHILHRPESYIGSVQLESQSLWVWDAAEQRMTHRAIEYVPGLYKIFDEILVNAADVKAREEAAEGQRRMTCIKVEIDQSQPSLTVYNDGEGIPIEIHKEHQVYVPELIFGHLLTSDNYDDSEARVTGGRNGYGAKLTNIFSTSFTVKCVDSLRKRKFVKTWRQNMSKSDKAEVSSCKETRDYVKINFVPDLAKFGLSHLSDDTVALFTKRVYDLAGCSGVKVWLNGKRLEVDSFKDYTNLYFKPPKLLSLDGLDQNAENVTPSKVLKIHEKAGRWEVVISASGGQFQQVSFVNSICTTKGGTHVNYVLEPLLQAILKKVNTKNKGGIEVKAHHMRDHIWLFVKSLIVNPTFDSQTKETLTLKPSQFGSRFTLSDRTIQAVIKSEILESVLLWAKTKQQVELQKKLKGVTGRSGRDRITGIPKLEDANDAGTKWSEHCTLILTEGESAKTSCVAGLSVVGKDRYGVFPLRGKLLNVREASFKQQVENQEIQAILKIMGLQVGKNIQTPSGLRYGTIMLMTDQDLDGSHIKGLLINMIAHYWPNLLKYQGFLRQFITPIVKAFKGNQKLSFYTLAEYLKWKEHTDNGRGWKIRYYKGLGTSTDQEFKEYFLQLRKHSLKFVFKGEQDINAIDMAFNGKRAEDRKQWIQAYDEKTFIDYTQPEISYSDFINKELVVFSKYDTFRSIPSCIDGLKPVQRKVLFAALSKNIKTEMKVAQFSSYVAAKTAYHHGEQGLGPTIVAMAQSFVGANNMPMLEACGQFGSRKEGGKDASAARYIFTKLTHFARAMFPDVDDALLSYRDDDGLMVEPEYYAPVIPLILVNGAEGIGTGWSTFVPNYNPREIIQNVRRFIRGEVLEPLAPWYRGFRGTIEQKESGGYESVGRVEKIDERTLLVTELPVKMWTQAFKQFLEDSLQDRVPETTEPGTRGRSRAAGGAGSSLVIQDYRDNSTHESIYFTITLSEEQMAKAERDGLEKAFRLRKAIPTTNMTLFNTDKKVHRYATELDIIREFGQLRLQYYQLRREYMLEKIERECRIIRNKVRFIEAIISQKVVISNKKRDALIKELIDNKFDRMSAIKSASRVMTRLEREACRFVDPIKESEENEEPVQEAPPLVKDFEYLLSMSLWSLTAEKIEELRSNLKKALDQLEKTRQKNAEDLWEDDLANLEKALDYQDQLDSQLYEESKKITLVPASMSSRSKPTKTPAPKKPKVTQRKVIDLDSESSNSDPPESKPPLRIAKKKMPEVSKHREKTRSKSSATTAASSSVAPSAESLDVPSDKPLSLLERVRQRTMAGASEKKMDVFPQMSGSSTGQLTLDALLNSSSLSKTKDTRANTTKPFSLFDSSFNEEGATTDTKEAPKTQKSRRKKPSPSQKTSTSETLSDDEDLEKPKLDKRLGRRKRLMSRTVDSSSSDQDYIMSDIESDMD